MKIVVKTLNGKTKLPLDIEPSWTIRQVKEQIEKEHDMKAEGLKLVAYGKVLENDDGLVSDYSLKEGDFVVAINQKAKPAPKAAGAKPEDAKMEDPVQQPAQD